MNTKEINYILKNVKNFKGTYCRDQLPIMPKKPFSLVINTDPCSEPGEHWVAIIVNKDKTGEYFDSFGLPPLHKDLWEYMENQCPSGWIFNQFTFQSLGSDTCGNYCILYIKSISKGYKYIDFLSIFTKNTIFNDKIVKSL